MLRCHNISQWPRDFLIGLISGGLLLGALLTLSQAQITTTITPDSSLGTTVTQNGSVHTITGGTRPGNGPNLFHSFDRFNVGIQDTASFTGPAGIENVVSRVTGGQRSTIDGRLQSTIPGANLYLLNPSGVLFGPSASLDVSGSFHISTADYLRFADGATFSAHLGAQSTLTVAPPAAFGFLGSTPSGISVQGSTLAVPPGKALSIVGGNIEITGDRSTTATPPNVAAPSGQITIASVASTGEVRAQAEAQTPAPEVGAFDRLGSITLGQGARIDASGNGGGKVVIRGGQLQVDGAQIAANTDGPAPGASPGIDIQATEAAVFTNGALLTTRARGAGNAGDIQVTAKRVEVSQAAGIRSISGAGTSGSPGNITITAPAGSVLVTGQESNIDSGTGEGSSGHAGRITTRADTLTLENGGQMRGFTFGTGAGGTVAVEVGQLTVTNGGRIEANMTTGSSGNGEPGMITVTATDQVIIDGANNPPQVTGLISQSAGTARAAGTIKVKTGRLQVRGAGQMSTSAVSSRAGAAGTVQVTAQAVDLSGPESKLVSTTAGGGNAGRVELNVDRLTMTEGARIDTGTNPGSTGNAGTIAIQASDAVTLASTNEAEARLVSRATGSGNGGQITLTTPQLHVGPAGRISAIALRGGRDGSLDFTRVGSLDLAGGLIDRLNEIVLDGSLGPSRTLTEVDITIDAALGQMQGTNLFHSMSRFRLLPGGTVTFTGPSHLTTIMSRITGEEPARIEGRLRSNIPGASLFLLAPRGVLFGAGARLESMGLLHMSTADYLRLDDGGRFWGSLTEPSTLTAGLPVAFGFTTAVPAPITMRLDRGILNVQGTGLSLVGGDITIATREELRAPGQQLHLVSVASPGEALFRTSGEVPAFQLAGFARRGAISLSDLAHISTSSNTGDSGPIEIHAGQVTVPLDAEITADAGASSAGKGGHILILADTLSVADGRIAASTTGPGHAGNIDLQVDRLVVTDGGLIASTQNASDPRRGSGNAGIVRIIARDIHVGGKNPGGLLSRITSATIGTGDAGGIDIQTQRLELTGGSLIGSDNATREATGRAGRIRIMATDEVVIAGPESNLSSTTRGRGQAGEIVLEAERLTITGGGRIATSATAGSSGAAGTVTVRARDVTISGQESAVSGLFSTTAGSGKAGEIVLEAERLTITGNGRIDSRTEGAEQGGDIVLQSRAIELREGATITAQSTGAGNAGRIAITATDTFLIDNSSVNTEATQASGGNIQVTARSMVRLRDSTITATVKGGPQTVGGNITIDPEFVILENSHIIAQALEGQGGRIQITAGAFVADANSVVSASSERGINGQVNIQALTNLSGLVAPLPQNFGLVAALLRDRCAARLREGRVSSLVERARQGVPVTPDGLLPGRLYAMPPRPATPTGTPQPAEATAVSRQGTLRAQTDGRVRRLQPMPSFFLPALAFECGKR